MKSYKVVVENQNGKTISFKTKVRDLAEAHAKGAEQAIKKNWANYSIQAEEK